MFVIKQMNSNKHYITVFCIPSNIYSYFYIITITIYQMCLKFSIKSKRNVNKKKVTIEDNLLMMFLFLIIQ